MLNVCLTQVVLSVLRNTVLYMGAPASCNIVYWYHFAWLQSWTEALPLKMEAVVACILVHDIGIPI